MLIVWFLRILSWLLAGVTISGSIILWAQTDNHAWLLLLLSSVPWFGIWVGAEELAGTKKEIKELRRVK